MTDMDGIGGADCSRSSDLKPGELVRLRNDPHRFGVFDRLVSRGGRTLARVRFPSGFRQIPLGQLERCPLAVEEPLDFLRAGTFSEPARLRQVIAHIRLTGQLSDMIYSMEATNTEFHAHQFKPVIKMLGSPTGSLLIADEVGLGKTIEAGLVWTELKARFDYQRLLVVCPKALVPKWVAELTDKFSIDARATTAADLVAAVDSPSVSDRGRGFTAVCGMQGLRPPRGWDDESSDTYRRASARLARILDDKAAEPDEPLFDLVVVDEAHHLRNSGTQTNRLAQLLQPVSRHLLFLSATPINLRDDDLYSLLNLVDPSTYSDPSVLREIILANTPLVRARDRILAGAPPEEIQEDLLEAKEHPLLSSNRQLATLRREVVTVSKSDPVARRVDIASRIEAANLLANTVNRTRRRDVEEFRVLRRPAVRRAAMSDEERKIYQEVTWAIQEFALTRDISAAFLSAMPQRLLASCLPAAIEHWRGPGAASDTVDDPEEEVVVQGDDARSDGDERPLLAAIRPIARRAPPIEKLEKLDTKYNELLHWLWGALKEKPDEKIIVFSTFRPTIDYLARRLRSDGLESLKIMGGVTDREDVIEQFRTQTIQVLLASEVGSEGLDLQFARTVVNYDMPWNPMKVEQRIGRVDRLGQTAESVSVVNFLVDETIDARIYDRLYSRLGLCERALGGFEEIIGKEVRQLTPDLVSGRLTDAELEGKLEQTASALEQRKRLEEEMETEAAALVAHGDHILRSIHAARGLHRWIDHSDLAGYIETALSSLHPGCEIIELEEEGLYDIGLTAEARAAAADFCDRHKLPRGRLISSSGRTRCRLARPAERTIRRRRAIETVTQTHPFVRYLAHRVSDTEASSLRPAIAARVTTAMLRTVSSPPAPGRYLIASEYWRFGGTLPQERIAYAGMALEERAPIADEAAEALMLAAAAGGSLWPNAAAQIDLDACARLAEGQLFELLAQRHVEEDEAIRAQKEDRAEVQIRSLERITNEQIRNVQEVVDRQRLRFSSGRNGGQKLQHIITANEGRIRKLRERMELRRSQIERSREHTSETEHLAIALVEVRP